MLTTIDRERMKQIDIYDFLRRTHPADLEVHNSWVRLRCNTSVNVRQGRSYWQDFSATTEKKYGDAIGLLTTFLGYTFQEATEEILNYLNGNPVTAKEVAASLPIKEHSFVMPKKSKEYPKQVYSYLGKTRHIPYKLIDMLLAGGYVYMTDSEYESKVIHNVVFTTPNHKFYEIRGCNTYGNAFHQSNALTENDCLILPGTDKAPKKIYVTEAAIDAISLLALKGLNGEREDAWFVALGGIAKIQPMKFLAEKYADAEIVIAVDNDAAGDKLREAYADQFTSIIPKNKDWNEDLCEVFKN